MRQSLADFDASLRRIQNLAQNIIQDTGRALSHPPTLELHETQQCGATVLLTGYFEAFLKDIVRRFLQNLSSSGSNFGSLPEDLQHRHFENGGRILTKASEAVRNRRTTSFGNATREDIVTRLYSAVSNSGSYQIVWEAFADTEASPKPDVVQRIGKSLGLNNFWPTIARKTGDPKKWSETALSAMLSDLIDKRNECAHTGRVSPVPTAQQLLVYAEMLAALGRGYVGALEDQLAAYTKPVPP